MEQFIHSFQGEMEVPGMFSWFHLIALIIIIASTFCLSFFFKNVEEKSYKRILLIGWIILVTLEILKQIIKGFHYGSPSYWKYDYYDFPFHVCSMALYLLPILIFVKKDKCPHLVDAVNGYLCFICLFAGVAVCIYTDMVMSRLIYTNVQTLIHHGMMVVLGVYIFVYNRRSITIKTYYKSLIAFAITASMAMLINVAFHPHGIDMFFLNPLQMTTLPVVDVVQKEAGFVVYLLGYLAVIAAISFMLYIVETSLYKLSLKKQKD